MNQLVTTGILLARTDFGEADRIITVLTPEQGKVRLMAKGVRRNKSKLAGGIELFSVSQITYLPGRGDIGTLISARLIEHFGTIVRDINRTMYGYEVLKTLNKITEDMPGEEYFALLKNSLAALDQPSLGLEIIRFWFDVQLLKLAGHSPNLRTDEKGQALKADMSYSFDLDNMAFSGSKTGNYQAGHIKLLRLAIGLDSPLLLRQVSGIDDLLIECLSLVKAMLR